MSNSEQPGGSGGSAGGRGRGRRWKKGESGNPNGRRKPPVSRADTWINEFAGYGTDRDRRIATYHLADTVIDQMARDLWVGNDLAARAIEAYPQDAMRGGYDFECGKDKIERVVTEAMGELDANLATARILEYERAYGGGAIYPVVNDGAPSLDLPLRLDRGQKIEHLLVLEPRELYPMVWEDGVPAVWQLRRMVQGGAAPPPVMIHASRLIIRPGIKVSSLYVRGALWGWGHSQLTRMNEVLRDVGVSWGSLASLLVDFAQGVWSIDGLAQMLATADGQEQLRARMLANEIARSTLRSIVIDAKDKFERTQSPVTGLADLIDRLMQRLAASVDMPFTRLMKVSPAGMNATGESDTRNWYDSVAAFQIDKAQPPVERELEILLHTKQGPTNGKVPPEWAVKWKPLWQPTDLERAQAHAAQSTADLNTINSGMASPEELAHARFGKSGYSYDTVIDFEARAKLDTPVPPLPGSAAASGLRDPNAPLVPGQGDAAAGGAIPPGKSRPRPTVDPADDEVDDEAGVAE